MGPIIISYSQKKIYTYICQENFLEHGKAREEKINNDLKVLFNKCHLGIL